MHSRTNKNVANIFASRSQVTLKTGRTCLVRPTPCTRTINISSKVFFYTQSRSFFSTVF